LILSWHALDHLQLLDELMSFSSCLPPAFARLPFFFLASLLSSRGLLEGLDHVFERLDDVVLDAT